MKKPLLLITVAFLLFLSACSSGGSDDSKHIKVIVSEANFNSEVIEVVKKEVEKQGFTLEYKVIADGKVGNEEVDNGNYDANSLQTEVYMNSFNAANKTHLVTAFYTAFPPAGIFSKKYKSFQEVPDGATIGTSTDAANFGRTLIMMQDLGLLKLKEGVQPSNATEKDIIDNPHHYKFKGIDNALLLRALDDLDASLLYASQIIQGGFVAKKDALALESEKTNDYKYVVATRPELKDSPKMKVLQKAWQSDSVKNFYIKKYGEGGIYFLW